MESLKSLLPIKQIVALSRKNPDLARMLLMSLPPKTMTSLCMSDPEIHQFCRELGKDIVARLDDVKIAEKKQEIKDIKSVESLDSIESIESLDSVDSLDE